MPQFIVTVAGRLPADVTAEQLETFVGSMRRDAAGAAYVRDSEHGRYEAVLPLGAETHNQAESLARLIVTSALFDSGFTRLTSSVDEVDSKAS